VRYRDQPTIEVTQRVRCDVGTAWALVTDIGLAARCSSGLEAVEWLGDANSVTLGARFRGRNKHEAFGAWETRVRGHRGRRRASSGVERHRTDGVGATWAFEVEPASHGVLIRQWARIRSQVDG
jgi:hypothetical protein